MDISLKFENVSPAVLHELLEVLERKHQDEPLASGASVKSQKEEKPQVGGSEPVSVGSIPVFMPQDLTVEAAIKAEERKIEEIRLLIVDFCKADHSNKDKIREVFKSLGVNCLSEVKPEDYGKLVEVING